MFVSLQEKLFEMKETRLCKTCSKTYCRACEIEESRKNGVKEIGKWLLDISKYMLTAILLSSIFTDFGGVLLYVLAIVAIAFTFVWGWLLVRK